MRVFYEQRKIRIVIDQRSIQA